VSEPGGIGAKTLNIGMVGLDTSHAVAFTRLLHDASHPHHVPGGRVVCAWPGGSPDFELSYSRVGRFTREMEEEFGVRIVDTPEQVAERCDAVMLEAADGRTHLELFRRIAPCGKPVFIDKPLAVTARDAEEIMRLAERYGVPVMSCSALRFTDGLVPAASAEGDAHVTGADVFGPMPFSPPTPGYFWYGIHAAEMLFAILGAGCDRVSAVGVGDHDLIVGTWADGRIGTVRGNRAGQNAFGALIHRADRVLFVEPPADLMPLYAGLLRRVLELFRTGRPEVDARETLGIIRFLEAANESRKSGGKPIRLGQ